MKRPRVVLALTGWSGARELAAELGRLGIPFVVPMPGTVVRELDCIAVYDSEEALVFAPKCSKRVRVGRTEPLLAVLARILREYLDRRSLRVGIDLGSRVTAAIVVNDMVVAVKQFRTLEGVEELVCNLIDELKPDTVTINVGAEGVMNTGVNVETLCGLAVNIVGELRSNNSINPLARDAPVQGLGKDALAALNIALA